LRLAELERRNLVRQDELVRSDSGGRFRLGLLPDFTHQDHFKIQRVPNSLEASMIGTFRKGGTFPDHNFCATADTFIYSKLLVDLAALRHAAHPPISRASVRLLYASIHIANPCKSAFSKVYR
jgi:hypothetical protein